MALDKRIGAAIQRLMADQEITQSALGQAAGMDQSNISRAIKGKQSLQPDQLAKIAKKLGVSVAKLVPDRDLVEPAEKTEGSKSGSDPSDKLPPNVEDFIRRRAHEFADGELDFFHEGEFRKAWPNLSDADDEQLTRLVKLHTGFALRAAKRSSSR